MTKKTKWIIGGVVSFVVLVLLGSNGLLFRWETTPIDPADSRSPTQIHMSGADCLAWSQSSANTLGDQGFAFCIAFNTNT